MNISRENVIYLVLGILLAALVYIAGRNVAPPQDANINPFKKLGNMSTQNGLIVEIFEFKECYVVAQTVPVELGRAAVQMVCP